MKGWGKSYWIPVVLLAVTALAGSGCGQEPAPTSGPQVELGPATITLTPTQEPLPDLMFSGGAMAVSNLVNGCVSEPGPLTTEVCVQNQGDGDAGPFTVRVLHRRGGDSFEWSVEGLAAGEEICFDDEGPSVGRATVDVEDVVVEADEFNNNFIVPLPPPTVVCTVAPTPTTTLTPQPLPPPSETPFPEGAKVTTEIFPVYDCVYLGNGIYEWYRAEVTYVDGEPVKEEIIRGPLQGEYVGGCPANPAEPQPTKPESS